MKYLFLFFLTLGCQDKITINSKQSTTIGAARVSKVQIENGKVELIGTNLSRVTKLRVLDGKSTHTFTIESKTDSKLIASSLANISFALDRAMNFLISDASATSSFIIDFTLCNSSLNGGRFDCSLTAQDKDVLAYDALSGTWRPKAINGISYKGVWDANDSFPTASDAGDYFIVGVGANGYSVGDWIVFNGTSFQKVDNSQSILSVFGRTGAITAQEGDYSLSQLSDVAFSTPPVASQTLVFNGTSWGARDISSIVNDSIQTFTGDKSFQGSVVAESGIKVGTVSTTCSSSSEGTLRYNSGTKKMEFCNSSSWSSVGSPSTVSATSATITIGMPSPTVVQNGPVSIPVTYGTNTDPATISLTANHIYFSGTGSSGCAVTAVTGTGLARTVTIDGCSGTGSVAILIAPGSAASTTGAPASGSAPSSTFSADNTGPASVTVTLGAVPGDTSSTPLINFPSATDSGGSSVDYYEARVLKTSDGSVAKDWTETSAGQALTGLTLSGGTQYSVEVRAVDVLGNIGAASSAAVWTTPVTDVCSTSGAAPGAVCASGMIYVGSLGSDRYMTTPADCGEIPSAQRVDAANSWSSYPSADFTPNCSGANSVAKTWNNGSGAMIDFPELVNYLNTPGVGNGSINLDANSGRHNSSYIVAITDINQGGAHAAARYCDKLVLGGYSDWYLPNRAELNLIFTNKGAIPGLSGNDYWSSTEVDQARAWYIRMQDGFAYYTQKSTQAWVRCIRSF